jgi:hypothetical protein
MTVGVPEVGAVLGFGVLVYACIRFWRSDRPEEVEATEKVTAPATRPAEPDTQTLRQLQELQDKYDALKQETFTRSQLERDAYIATQGAFMGLTWAQKLAVKIVCWRGTTSETSLYTDLERLGFGTGQELMDRIVNPTLRWMSKAAPPEGPARFSDIERIVNHWKWNDFN